MCLGAQPVSLRKVGSPAEFGVPRPCAQRCTLPSRSFTLGGECRKCASPTAAHGAHAARAANGFASLCSCAFPTLMHIVLLNITRPLEAAHSAFTPAGGAGHGRCWQERGWAAAAASRHVPSLPVSPATSATIATKGQGLRPAG